MSANLITYQLRIPPQVKEKLPRLAEDHGMKTQDFIRAILGLVVAGKISLSLEDNRNEKLPAAD